MLNVGLYYIYTYCLKLCEYGVCQWEPMLCYIQYTYRLLLVAGALLTYLKTREM